MSWGRDLEGVGQNCSSSDVLMTNRILGMGRRRRVVRTTRQLDVRESWKCQYKSQSRDRRLIGVSGAEVIPSCVDDELHHPGISWRAAVLL